MTAPVIGYMPCTVSPCGASPCKCQPCSYRHPLYEGDVGHGEYFRLDPRDVDIHLRYAHNLEREEEL